MAVIFDTTIVNVALHTLSVKLDTPVTTIQWMSTGYLLALGIAVPLSTWGLQRFGSKRLWMFSLAVFLVGSNGSSLAWNAGSLIGWRVVQGVGGGFMLPPMTTLIFQAAPLPAPGPGRRRHPRPRPAAGPASARTCCWPIRDTPTTAPGRAAPVRDPLQRSRASST